MNAPHASDEVTDLIASIEMHRQEIERESGLEASRNYALPRLQELLRAEQEASQQPDAELNREVNRAANIEAVNVAIRKLQSLGRGGGQRQGQGKQPRPFQGPGPGPGGARRDNNQRRERHRGRRSQARRGGR